MDALLEHLWAENGLSKILFHTNIVFDRLQNINEIPCEFIDVLNTGPIKEPILNQYCLG